MLRRLAELGVRAEAPFRSGFIGEVYVMLTMDCNIRCRACSLWGLGGACPPEERERLRMGPPGHYEAMVRGLGKLGALVEHLERRGIVFDEILFQHLIYNSPAELAAQAKAFREEFGLGLGLWKGYGYGGRKGAAGAAYCDGPWTQVNVLPNGLVWACPDFILGDLMEQDLESLWDGPRARALRRRVCRNLFPACRGCFSFYGKEQPLGADAQPPARRSR